MKIKTYYEILEVSEVASTETIRAAYRSLSKRFHPDNAKTGNEATFKLISEAHEHLTDERKRREYDGELQKSRKPASAEGAYEGPRTRKKKAQAAPVESVPVFDAAKSVEALFTLGHLAMDHYGVDPILRTVLVQVQPDIEKLAVAAINQAVQG